MATAPLDTLLHRLHQLAAGSRVALGTDRQLLDDFTARRDETAFAALVARHGPMVLRVCQRVLDHEHDAEDAFQATFLVLAKNTAGIRKREALAAWLHGVAYRTAMKAKRSAARRRKHEARVHPLPTPKSDPTWKEVRRVLDEEIQRLPEHYRTAFTLCILEGKSVPEAAAQLGCKLGTVSSWLTRARQRLQQRLARRGIELTALLAALSVAENGQAGVPDALAQTTIRFGLWVAAGESAAETIPSDVAQLATGVTRAMFLTKAAKIATAILLAVVLIASAGMQSPRTVEARERPLNSPKPEPAAAKEREKPPATDEKGDSVEVSGRVVDPDGKPVAGAKVFFARSNLAFRRDPPPPPPPSVSTDAKGRFRFRVSKTGYLFAVEKVDWLSGGVFAVASGYAAGSVYNDRAEKLVDVTIKLTRDVPIQGRVFDLEGRPVAGVSVRVQSYHASGTGDLKAWVEDLKAKKGYSVHSLGSMNPAYQLGLAQPVVTGADGKFRLTGVGAERVVALRFEGPTIATSDVYVVTRPCPTVVMPRDKKRPHFGSYVYHGPTFDHVVAPTMPIVGTVRAKDTGKPLAGVTIRAHLDFAYGDYGGRGNYVIATTNKEGRYRLVGLPKMAGQYLWVTPAPGQPYLPPPRKTMGVSSGVNPLTVDFQMKRGVLIRGRVTDKDTGQPVPAVVEYFTSEDNPHYKKEEVLWGLSFQTRTAQDGSYTLVGLPGRGLLATKASYGENFGYENSYRRGVGADKIKEPILTHLDRLYPVFFNTLVEINPARGAASIRQDLALDPIKKEPGDLKGKNTK
jgi:RNA polymerase sigma factor (sigma-70 family)